MGDFAGEQVAAGILHIDAAKWSSVLSAKEQVLAMYGPDANILSQHVDIHRIPVVWSLVVMGKRNQRIPVDINCWLEGRWGISCVSTFDLSETGVSLLCSDPVSVGDIMTLRFFTPFSVEPITVQGELIWSRTDPEGRMGLRFIGMHENTKGILKSTAQLLRTWGQNGGNMCFPP